jgi:hypothetical protein
VAITLLLLLLLLLLLHTALRSLHCIPLCLLCKAL